MTATQTQQQREDFKTLGRFMLELPAKNLNMVSWCGDHESIFEANTSCDVQVREAIECGTSCCLAGWSALLFRDRWPVFVGSKLNFLDVCNSNFAHFFGLSNRDSEILCLKGLEMTPKQKGKQILALAAHLLDAS